MDVRSTGIIGRASVVRINYRKWVGPSIDTTDPSHSEFQVWCSSVAWLWSYSLPKVSPNISKIGQLYVLSDSVPCLFSKATVGKISAALASSMTHVTCGHVYGAQIYPHNANAPAANACKQLQDSWYRFGWAVPCCLSIDLSKGAHTLFLVVMCTVHKYTHTTLMH